LLRLFVAILLEERVRAALSKVQQRLGGACEGVRWVKPEQLHLTVKFLGDVEASAVTGISEAMAAAAAEAEPTSMTVSGAGCFPPRGDVRIVWAGASDPSNHLNAAVESIHHALQRLGFKPERRRWSPHITIGRVKFDRSGGRIRSAVAQASYPDIAQSVSSVTLMSSVLSPTGPTYESVFTCPLGAP
jgi:2'-5' RNA ligase